MVIVVCSFSNTSGRVEVSISLMTGEEVWTGEEYIRKREISMSLYMHVLMTGEEVRTGEEVKPFQSTTLLI